MPEGRRSACLDLDQADDVHEHWSHAARIAPMDRRPVIARRGGMAA